MTKEKKRLVEKNSILWRGNTYDDREKLKEILELHRMATLIALSKRSQQQSRLSR
jgi:hypothetical protein